jgi:hypothetical protein
MRAAYPRLANGEPDAGVATWRLDNKERPESFDDSGPERLLSVVMTSSRSAHRRNVGSDVLAAVQDSADEARSRAPSRRGAPTPARLLGLATAVRDEVLGHERVDLPHHRLPPAARLVWVSSIRSRESAPTTEASAPNTARPARITETTISSTMRDPPSGNLLDVL